jgi:poly-gamma-glutamate synthesis protein (capsule biosynthesis protein)
MTTSSEGYASIDWTDGTWSRPGRGETTHRMVFAGDWCPRGSLGAEALRDPEAIYGDLLPVLRGGDLRVVNLEGPLAVAGDPIPKDGPNFRLAPECGEALRAVSFDLACLANNHVMDFGSDGLAETLATLDGYGVRGVGAGLTREDAMAPAHFDLGTVRVAVVNFCEGEDGTGATAGPGTFGWEPAAVVRTIRDARELADVVVVVAHAGREHVPVPPPYVQRLYRELAEAGADAVIGHHPHVPQGVEIHRGVPIVYSLGNFVFQQRGPVFRKFGLVLEVELDGSTVAGLRLEPFRIGPEGLRRVRGAEREWLLRQLDEASAVLEDPERVRDAWNAYLDSLGEGFWVGQVRPSLLESVSARLRLAPGTAEFNRRAACRRNFYTTPAHHHLRGDGLSRTISGEMGSAPEWARRLVERWLHLENPDLESPGSS